MKKILIFILSIFYISCFAETYYIRDDGDNGNTGLSDEQAWQTIAYVVSQTFSPGDSILFKTGDTWRETLNVDESGTLGNVIFYGAYGTGNRPEILGSDSSTTFENVTGDIWRCVQTFDDPYSSFDGEVTFEELDGSITLGWSKIAYTTTFDNMDEEYEWSWNNDSIYFYSPTDPNTRYACLEIPQRDNCIYISNESYLEFDSLRLAYSCLSGIRDPYVFQTEYGDSNITVSYCEVCHLGVRNDPAAFGIYMKYTNMWIHHCNIHHCGRRSISLNIWENEGWTFNTSNILIENNIFHHGYHTTGPDIARGDVEGITDSLIIRNNLFYEDPDFDFSDREASTSIMIYIDNDQNANSVFSNFYIYNNVFIGAIGSIVYLNNIDTCYVANNTFYGWNQTNSGYNAMIYITDHMHETYIYNNIFYNNSVYSFNQYLFSIFLNEAIDNVIDSVYMDYNMYYNTDASVRFLRGGGVYYDTTDWSSYLSTTGFGANSFHTDNPTFVNPTSDLSLQSSSNAIDNGLDLSFVTTDYDGTARSNTDMGAYEYTEGGGGGTTYQNNSTLKGNILLKNGQTKMIRRKFQ